MKIHHKCKIALLSLNDFHIQRLKTMLQEDALLGIKSLGAAKCGCTA